MSKMQVLIIIATTLIFSLYFFYKASGSLNPGKFNIITVTAGLFFLQSFIGISLIMLGYDQHYTIAKRLADKETTVNVTFFAVMGTAVLFPAAMYLFTRIFGVDSRRDYGAYLKKKTEYSDSSFLFWLVAACTILCVGLLALYVLKIGYLPLYKLFFHDAEFNMGTERIRISSLYLINQYVTNILIHMAIPVMAYFTFCCALTSKSKRWWVLAGILLVAAVVERTYNFAKAPVIYFLVVYVFILIYFLGGVKLTWMLAVGACGLLGLVLMYTLHGATLDVADIYNGIWGRLFFTQVGTLSFNFELFPEYIPYLEGRSLGSLLLPMFGFTSADQVRSSRILMEVYGSESVYNGTAGVMNSLFIGEAYANFGWFGLIFSIVWIAFVISGVFVLVLRMRKTPATLTMFAYFTVYISTTTQGGFTDFLYNVGWIVVFCAMMICHYLCIPHEENRKWNLRLFKRKS